MPEPASASRAVELVTAVLLGLISLATALVAWQGAAWTMSSDEFERSGSNARDVSVTQAVLADYARTTDAEVSARARLSFEKYVAEQDPLVALELANDVQSEIARSSYGFSDVWFEWAGQGFPDETPALQDDRYLVQRDGLSQSYGEVAALAASFSDDYQKRAQTLTQASLVFALALFLVGISGVNRSVGVRKAVLALGTVVFLAGLLITASAY